MGRNHYGSAHIQPAHPSGNTPPPHGWHPMGRTRSAPRQTPRRRRIGNSQTPHGWNLMGKNHYAPGPFAARRPRLRPQDPQQQCAATSGGILHQEPQGSKKSRLLCVPLMAPKGKSNPFQYRRNALPHADAHSSQSALQPAFLHFMRGGGNQPRTTHAQRIAAIFARLVGAAENQIIHCRHSARSGCAWRRR